jgi:anti-sigma B factor antagonist
MDQSAAVGRAHGITVTQDDGTVLVRLHGEIDAGLRDAASQAMVTVVAGDGPLVIDTSGVTFIDSSGLAFLLQVHGVVTEAGRPVTLRDPSRAVLDLLALVGLDRLFPSAEAQGV